MLWSISEEQSLGDPFRLCAGMSWWCVVLHSCSYVTSLQEEKKKKRRGGKRRGKRRRTRAKCLCDLISKSCSGSGDEKPQRVLAGLISTSWNRGASPAVTECLRPLREKKVCVINFLLQRLCCPVWWLAVWEKIMYITRWTLSQWAVLLYLIYSKGSAEILKAWSNYENTCY